METEAIKSIKNIDGEPWEVADEASRRLLTAYSDALEVLEDFEWAGRNSWMSQEFHRTKQMPSIDEFEQSPLGRGIARLREQLGEGHGRVAALGSAAAYDPRSR